LSNTSKAIYTPPKKKCISTHTVHCLLANASIVANARLIPSVMRTPFT